MTLFTLFILTLPLELFAHHCSALHQTGARGETLESRSRMCDQKELKFFSLIVGGNTVIHHPGQVI